MVLCGSTHVRLFFSPTGLFLSTKLTPDTLQSFIWVSSSKHPHNGMATIQREMDDRLGF